MDDEGPIPISEAKIFLEFTGPPENYGWVPDDVEIYVEPTTDREPRLLSYTSLQQLVKLLDCLEQEVSKLVVIGTSGLDVQFEGEEVTLKGGLELVGDAGTTKRLVRELVYEIIREIEKGGADAYIELESLDQNGSVSFTAVDLYDEALR